MSCWRRRLHLSFGVDVKAMPGMNFIAEKIINSARITRWKPAFLRRQLLFTRLDFSPLVLAVRERSQPEGEDWSQQRGRDWSWQTSRHKSRIFARFVFCVIRRTDPNKLILGVTEGPKKVGGSRHCGVPR